MGHKSHKKSADENGQRGATPKTVLLSKGGYLRISYDMISNGQYGFVPFGYRAQKRLELAPAADDSDPATLKIVYSNKGALSPQIGIKGVMKRVMGIPLPKKSVEYEAIQKQNGTVVVQF